MKLDWLHQIMMGPTHCDEAKHTPPFADSSISSKRLSYQDELIMSEKLSEAHLLKRRIKCIFLLGSKCLSVIFDYMTAKEKVKPSKTA